MGNLGLVLMGEDMLSKSLTQFSVNGWGRVPSLWFGLRLNYGKGNGSNGNLLHTAPRTVLFSAHDPTAGPMEIPGHSQASMAQSLVGSLLLSPGSW